MTKTVNKTVHDHSLFTEEDIYLFKEGTHRRLYSLFGAKVLDLNGIRGTYFALWAPNAKKVYVTGDFNSWDKESHPLCMRPDSSGIWEGFIPHVAKGTRYKYHIKSSNKGYSVEKCDPYGRYMESPPSTASIVWDQSMVSDNKDESGAGIEVYTWHDSDWMASRREKNSVNGPISIYEVHLGSWMRVTGESDTWGGETKRYLTYVEAGEKLLEYALDMGYTHVEIMPVMEHPFYGSWGYQVTGYYAPTSRYGTPEELKEMIDTLHRGGIGVILDWVPSHFPSDGHGLSYFDGTYLFEHEDPKKGYHPEWNSSIFNYDRTEVSEFLINNALYWLDEFHADGLRVDGVASMLYLDYGRKEGEWIPNEFGGREDLGAIEFLKRLNEAVYSEFPDVQTFAEESTSWPMVSKPTYLGGLGFGLKWNMGWMNDTIDYMKHDPVHRRYYHNDLTFSICYAFSENFTLPLSHDEVVHGKGSLCGKMPGDEWQRYANLRLMYAYMYTHPGKKLLFMGCDFGQVSEWRHEESLEWHVLEYEVHRGVHDLVRDLNRLYRDEGALHNGDCKEGGFEWIDCHDGDQSVISYLRIAPDSGGVPPLVVICNFTPVIRESYRVGVPSGGRWSEVLNTDARVYGGSGVGNLGGVTAEEEETHFRPFTIKVTLPPLSVLVLKES